MPISISFITLFPSIRVHLLRFIVHHLRLLIYCLDQVRRGSQKIWGSSHRVYGEVGAPQGPTRCAPGAPLLGQYCLLWGESPNMTSPVHHQKPPCAYKHSSRQQHYSRNAPRGPCAPDARRLDTRISPSCIHNAARNPFCQSNIGLAWSIALSPWHPRVV